MPSYASPVSIQREMGFLRCSIKKNLVLGVHNELFQQFWEWKAEVDDAMYEQTSFWFNTNPAAEFLGLP